MSTENQQRQYNRLTKADRCSIEVGLKNHEGARKMARDLNRSASTITDEIRRNRTVSKGPRKGERVTEVPAEACPLLLKWPWVCTGCKYHNSCQRRWKCEYSAIRAQTLADELLVSARRGVDTTQQNLEYILSIVRADLARGLSPAQISAARADELGVSTSTIYRWIDRGYCGMANIELLRKVGYKPRKKPEEIKPTAHGSERSYKAFTELPIDVRATACEMDCVIGKSTDKQCILTLYLRPCHLQLCILLPEKTTRSVRAAFDMLEQVLGEEIFGELFSTILTDNGTEFSDYTGIEHSILAPRKRCRVYYCDVRQSQQKAGCERNHVELRKILPKERGISFDCLESRDMAVLMSHLNSEPRESLRGKTPLQAMRADFPKEADAITAALGIEDIDFNDLNMTIDALDESRAGRGVALLSK